MTEDQLPHQGPVKGDCQGNPDKCSRDDCPLFGSLLKPNRDGQRRVRGCGDPVARGTRNKRAGGKRQAKAARAIGVPRSSVSPGNEEHFGGAVRVEVKSGAQVGPIITRYLNARLQSEAARPIGDHRPFVFVAMPESARAPGLLVVDLKDLPDVIAGLAENLGMNP